MIVHVWLHGSVYSLPSNQSENKIMVTLDTLRNIYIYIYILVLVFWRTHNIYIDMYTCIKCTLYAWIHGNQNETDHKLWYLSNNLHTHTKHKCIYIIIYTKFLKLIPDLRRVVIKQNSLFNQLGTNLRLDWRLNNIITINCRLVLSCHLGKLNLWFRIIINLCLESVLQFNESMYKQPQHQLYWLCMDTMLVQVVQSLYSDRSVVLIWSKHAVSS